MVVVLDDYNSLELTQGHFEFPPIDKIETVIFFLWRGCIIHFLPEDFRLLASLSYL